jgi:hypothetical protein
MNNRERLEAQRTLKFIQDHGYVHDVPWVTKISETDLRYLTAAASLKELPETFSPQEYGTQAQTTGTGVALRC